jgi:hypothetical protein
MATSAFSAVARMALPRRLSLRNRYTPAEMATAITKLITLLWPTAIVRVSRTVPGA